MQRSLELVRGLADLASVPGPAAQSEVAVNVVGAVHENLLVQLLRPVVLVQHGGQDAAPCSNPS